MKLPTSNVAPGRYRVVAVADKDWWMCLCGNTPRQEGFYPCTAEGAMVGPTADILTTPWPWYVCDRCGRIIDQDTREVVGVRSTNTLTDAERQAIRAHR